jgi:hypothetical protein
MTCSQIGSLPHCLTQPKLGSIMHSHRSPLPYLRLLESKKINCLLTNNIEIVYLSWDGSKTDSGDAHRRLRFLLFVGSW